MKSEFEKWFVAQFGPRPLTVKNEEKLICKLPDLRFAMRDAEDKLSRCRQWDEFQNAALYAWNARGKK